MWLLLSHPAFAQWAVAPIGDDPPAADAPTRWNSSFLHADDLDGDGYPEVLASDSLEDDLSTFPSVDGWAYGPRLSLPNAVNDLVDGSDVNTGDFDGDGDLDLVLHASVFRNDGGFTYTYDGGLPSADFLRAADLDGDGAVDLVGRSEGDHTVDWYPNTDGSFWTRIELVPDEGDHQSEHGLAVGDVDADGDVDIVSSWLDVKLVENLGGGAFAAPVVLLAAQTGEDLELVDLDGDGALDLASRTPDGTLWWSRNLGGGTFDAVEVVESDPELVDYVPIDLDGDGDVDLAASHHTSDEVAWLQNLGGGAFATAEVLVVADHVSELEAADLDADGIEDLLAVPSINPIGPFRVALDTDGDGLADGAEIHRHGSDPLVADTDGGGVDDEYEVRVARTDPADPADDDTDADGLSDNDEQALGLDPSDPDMDDDGVEDGAELDLGTDPLVADTDGGGVPDGEEVSWGTDPTLGGDDDLDYDGLGADEETSLGTDPLDEDTDDDALTDPEELDHGTDPLNPDTDGGGAPDGEEIDNGTDPAGDLTDDWPATVVPTDGAQPYALALGDLDLDGDDDLVVGSASGVAWHPHDGVGAFGAGTPITAGATYAVEAADLDADGDPDLAIAGPAGSAWLENDGAAGFSSHTLSASPSATVAVADLEADGDLDLLAGDQAADEILLFRSTGGGAFDPPEAVGGTRAQSGLAAFDLEQDGDLDIAAVGAQYDVYYVDTTYYGHPGWYIFDRGQARVLRDDGAAYAPIDLGGAPPYPQYVRAATAVEATDLDADGFTDLVVCLHDTIGWYRNAGGTLSPFERLAEIYSGCAGLAIGDREGDGDLDVFLGGGDNPWFPSLSWIEGRRTAHPIEPDNGERTLIEAGVIELEYEGGRRDDQVWDPIEDLALGDVDGDGDLDLIAAVTGLSQVRWHRNTLDLDGDRIADALDVCQGDDGSGDADGDGFCLLAVGGAVVDCDDGQPTVYPGAPELCDGRDNACLGSVPADEADADGDLERICAGDCDDTSAASATTLPEVCGDGVDNDCDGADAACEGSGDGSKGGRCGCAAPGAPVGGLPVVLLALAASRRRLTGSSRQTGPGRVCGPS